MLSYSLEDITLVGTGINKASISQLHGYDLYVLVQVLMLAYQFYFTL